MKDKIYAQLFSVCYKIAEKVAGYYGDVILANVTFGKGSALILLSKVFTVKN